MLKWAVHQPRPSYFNASDSNSQNWHNEFQATAVIADRRQKLRRRSTTAVPRTPAVLDKENHITSTPLPALTAKKCRTPLLKDLSNIMATPAQQASSPWHTPTPSSQTLRARPNAYASTLPTFEAEYSPSTTLIPGPLLALRGLCIPDSYFEKPRYLEQKPLQPAASAPCEQPTLSSTQMGDVTLERMIDAILESTRKAAPATARSRSLSRPRQRLRHKQRQQQRQLASAVIHSPTYRPAFDPASDLCEYWQQPAAAGTATGAYEEREVRSPRPSQIKLLLRRQRVVRRKRRISAKISSSVRQSAQKLLAAARSTQKLQRHISPDSGHNSTSDCELDEQFDGDALEASCKLDEIWLQHELPPLQARDVTKRRLSFSHTDDVS